MIQNAALAASASAVAITQIGVKEATGHNDGVQVHVYQDYIGKWVEGLPWCACFVSWCIGQSAQKLGVSPLFQKDCSVPRLAAQAKKDGTFMTTPEPYCIFLLKNAAGGYEHTGLVQSVDLKAGIVHTIDGNYGNCVCRTAHPIAHCDFMAIA